MTKIYSKALHKSIEVKRLIGHIKSSLSGPTLIFIGGIHGNEPSGVFALHQVLNELPDKEITVRGNIYAISGNLWALEHGKRYEKQDLNRLWTHTNIARILKNKIAIHNEDVIQQIDIYNTILKILKTERGPFYFMDLHTTSSKTVPFITVNDSLLNRKFTMQYPLPMILGIEEYLEGPLLNYINELGYVSFGFEAGQHDDIVSIENHISFIYLTLTFTGCILKNEIDYQHYYQALSKNSLDYKNVYEIFWRYEIQKNEVFSMKPGFTNFQKIEKRQAIATSNGKTLVSPKQGKIFMPLYQNQGSDGFFTIKKTPKFFLNLSKTLRNIKLNHMLPLLPGVQWNSDKRGSIKVNKKIARFFPKQFFHLLGYRVKQIDKDHFILKSREITSKTKEYQRAPWIKKNSTK